MFENCPSGINPEFSFFFIISLFTVPEWKMLYQIIFQWDRDLYRFTLDTYPPTFSQDTFNIFNSPRLKVLKKSVIRIVNSELKCDFLWNFEPIVFDAHLTLNPIKANNHWLTTFFYCLNLPLLMYISSYMSVGWWLFNMPVRLLTWKNPQLTFTQSGNTDR